MEQKHERAIDRSQELRVTIYTWPKGASSIGVTFGASIPHYDLGHSALKTWSGGKNGSGVYVSFYPGHINKKNKGDSSCEKDRSHFHGWYQEQGSLPMATRTDLYGLDVEAINRAFESMCDDQMYAVRQWNHKYNCADVVLALLRTGKIEKLLKKTNYVDPSRSRWWKIVLPWLLPPTVAIKEQIRFTQHTNKDYARREHFSYVEQRFLHTRQGGNNQLASLDKSVKNEFNKNYIWAFGVVFLLGAAGLISSRMTGDYLSTIKTPDDIFKLVEKIKACQVKPSSEYKEASPKRSSFYTNTSRANPNNTSFLTCFTTSHLSPASSSSVITSVSSSSSSLTGVSSSSLFAGTPQQPSVANNCKATTVVVSADSEKAEGGFSNSVV